MNSGTAKRMRREQCQAARGSWMLRGDDAPVQPAVAAALPVAVIAAPADGPCAAPVRLVSPSASCLHPPRLRCPLPSSLVWTLLLLLLGSSHFLLSECASVVDPLARAGGRYAMRTNDTPASPVGGIIETTVKTTARVPVAVKNPKTQPAGAPDAPNNQAPSLPVAPETDQPSLEPGDAVQGPVIPKKEQSLVTQAAAATLGSTTDTTTTAGTELAVALVPISNLTTDSTTPSTTPPTTSKAPSTTSTPKSKSSGEKVPIKRPTEEKDGPQIKPPPAGPPNPQLPSEDMDMEKEREEENGGLNLDEEEDKEMRPAGGKTHDLQGMVAAPREVHLNEKALLAVDDGQNHAFGYFVVLLVGSVALIAFWRKRQRILAYLIEGRRSSGRRRTGSRAGGAQVQYRKLHGEED